MRADNFPKSIGLVFAIPLLYLTPVPIIILHQRWRRLVECARDIAALPRSYFLLTQSEGVNLSRVNQKWRWRPSSEKYIINKRYSENSIQSQLYFFLLITTTGLNSLKPGLVLNVFTGCFYLMRFFFVLNKSAFRKKSIVGQSTKCIDRGQKSTLNKNTRYFFPVFRVETTPVVFRLELKWNNFQMRTSSLPQKPCTWIKYTTPKLSKVFFFAPSSRKLILSRRSTYWFVGARVWLWNK